MYVNFFREFYSWDRFLKITLIIGIFLLVTGYAWVLGTALIIYSIWKSKSSSVHGRNNEKFVFENARRNFYYKINNFKQNMKLHKFNIKKYNLMEKLKEKRKYIITSCPKCTQKLRLPRGKGKMIVTCSKCGSEFRLKT